MSTKPRRSARPRLEIARGAAGDEPAAVRQHLRPDPSRQYHRRSAWATRRGRVSASATTVTIAPQNITRGQGHHRVRRVRPALRGERDRPADRRRRAERQEAAAPAGRGPTARGQAGQATDQSVAFFETGTVRARDDPGRRARVEHRSVHRRDDPRRRRQRRRARSTWRTCRPFANDLCRRSPPGDADYIAAADYNQNGIVNLYDALALERNMTPLTKPRRRLGGDQPGAARRRSTISGPTNLGGVDRQARTSRSTGTPRRAASCSWTRPWATTGSTARPSPPTRAASSRSRRRIRRGSTPTTSRSSTPFGHQYIRSFPVFWTVYAEPDSPYHFKPSRRRPRRRISDHGGEGRRPEPRSSGQSGTGRRADRRDPSGRPRPERGAGSSGSVERTLARQVDAVALALVIETLIAAQVDDVDQPGLGEPAGHLLDGVPREVARARTSRGCRRRGPRDRGASRRRSSPGGARRPAAARAGSGWTSAGASARRSGRRSGRAARARRAAAGSRRRAGGP